MDQDETWHAGRPRPGQIVLDGDPAPPSQKGHSPQFSAHVCSGQTAGWIKMPLGTEVDLGPGETTLFGDPAPPPKKGGGTAPPILAYALWPNSCMDEDASWYEARPRARPQCVTCGPSSVSPQFSAHVCCGQTAGRIKYATRCGDKSRPMPHCVR